MERSYYEPEADETDYFHFSLFANRFTPAHFHNNMEMIFVKSGQFRIIINGTEKCLSAGDIAVSNRFDVHFYESIGETESYVLLLGTNYTERFSSYFNKDFQNYIPSSAKTAEILVFVENFHKNYREMNRLLLSGQTDTLLGLLSDAYPLKEVSLKRNNYIVEILKYMNDNFTERLTLESVASYFGYTRNHFSSLFNKYTGMRFKDYLNRLRIEKADKFKGSEKVTVTKLALECGFDSLNTYYRALKKFSK